MTKRMYQMEDDWRKNIAREVSTTRAKRKKKKTESRIVAKKMVIKEKKLRQSQKKLNSSMNEKPKAKPNRPSCKSTQRIMPKRKKTHSARPEWNKDVKPIKVNNSQYSRFRGDKYSSIGSYAGSNNCYSVYDIYNHYGNDGQRSGSKEPPFGSRTKGSKKDGKFSWRAKLGGSLDQGQYSRAKQQFQLESGGRVADRSIGRNFQDCSTYTAYTDFDCSTYVRQTINFSGRSKKNARERRPKDFLRRLLPRRQKARRRSLCSGAPSAPQRNQESGRHQNIQQTPIDHQRAQRSSQKRSQNSQENGPSKHRQIHRQVREPEEHPLGHGALRRLQSPHQAPKERKKEVKPINQNQNFPRYRKGNRLPPPKQHRPLRHQTREHRPRPHKSSQNRRFRVRPILPGKRKELDHQRNAVLHVAGTHKEGSAPCQEIRCLGFGSSALFHFDEEISV